MDSISKQSYDSNKLLLKAVGVYPYQNKVSSYFALFIFCGIAGSQLCCKIAFVVLAWPDIDVVIQCTSPILIDIICIIKLANAKLKLTKIKGLFEQMLFFEDSTLDIEERKIMESHAKNSAQFTTIWSTYMYSVLILYQGLPLLPQVLGTIGNDTRQLPAPVYYYVDIQKYYYPIFVHAFASGFLFVTSLIAADTMFAALVEHACGMFSVVGYRLRKAVKPEKSDKNSAHYEDVAYENFIDCIIRHRRAIRFAEDIESSHTETFFLTVGTNMLIMSFTGVQIMANTDELHLLLSQSALVAGQLCHLYMENYFAQKLLDHSLSVYSNIFTSNWYNASLRTQKLLCMLAMRSLVPTVLTTGGIYVMSLQNFAWLLRASASYFTLLRSFQ